MDHRIGPDAHAALSEIARATEAHMTANPGAAPEDVCIETRAPSLVLRDLRDRGFIRLMLGARGKTLAVLLDAGRAYLLFEGEKPADASGGPARRRVFTDRDALAFAR